MKLYYCFNGLYDYEYEVGIDNVVNAIYQKFNFIIEEKAVDFYFINYNSIISDFFIDNAYWQFLQEERCDLLDERLLKKYKRIMKEENKMLYENNKEVTKLVKCVKILKKGKTIWK